MNKELSLLASVFVPESNGVPSFFGKVIKKTRDGKYHIKRYGDELIFERAREQIEDKS